MAEPSIPYEPGKKQARLDSFFKLCAEDLRETIQFLIEHRPPKAYG